MINKREKLVHNIAAKYILGENVDVELTGNKYEMECFVNLLEVSKLLYKKLNDKNASLQEINKFLQEKKDLTKRFESLSGITWRL